MNCVLADIKPTLYLKLNFFDSKRFYFCTRSSKSLSQFSIFDDVVTDYIENLFIELKRSGVIIGSEMVICSVSIWMINT